MRKQSFHKCGTASLTGIFIENIDMKMGGIFTREKAQHSLLGNDFNQIFARVFLNDFIIWSVSRFIIFKVFGADYIADGSVIVINESEAVLGLMLNIVIAIVIDDIIAYAFI